MSSLYQNFRFQGRCTALKNTNIYRFTMGPFKVPRVPSRRYDPSPRRPYRDRDHREYEVRSSLPPSPQIFINIEKKNLITFYKSTSGAVLRKIDC